MTNLVRKSEFARITNTHRSRVSHWIADKKLDGAAIVGIGRTALINVPVALDQLRLRLDTDGLCRTGLNTRLYPAPAKPTANPAVNLLEEITIFEAAGWRIARALVGAGWPTTERKAWETLMEGFDRLDDAREEAEAA